MMGKSAVPVQIVMFIVYLMKNSSMYLKNYEEKNPKLYSLLKVKVRKIFFFSKILLPLSSGLVLWKINLLTVDELSYLLVGCSTSGWCWVPPRPGPCSCINFPKHLCQYVHRNTWLHVPPDERLYFHHVMLPPSHA